MCKHLGTIFELVRLTRGDRRAGLEKSLKLSLAEFVKNLIRRITAKC